MYKNYNPTNDAFYLYYPPEYRVFNAIIEGMPVPSVRSVLDFYQKAFEPINVSGLFSAFNIDIQSDVTKLIEDVQKLAESHKRPGMKTPMKHTLRKALMESALLKIDIYSLGISLASMMYMMKLLDRKVVESLSKTNALKLTAVEQVIHHMIRPNVFERWDTFKATEALMHLLTCM